MIIVDTSAWVEYLRATGSATDERLHRLLCEGGAVGTTEPVVMELLAGCDDEQEARQVRRMLGACELYAVQGLADFERAAALRQACRRAGETPRSLVDCLIATVAIRRDAAVLHCDRDFDVIGRHSALRCLA